MLAEICFCGEESFPLRSLTSGGETPGAASRNTFVETIGPAGICLCNGDLDGELQCFSMLDEVRVGFLRLEKELCSLEHQILGYTSLSVSYSIWMEKELGARGVVV